MVYFPPFFIVSILAAISYNVLRIKEVAEGNKVV